MGHESDASGVCNVATFCHNQSPVVWEWKDSLGEAVGADDVLDLVRVRVLEAEAGRAQPHPLAVLGAEPVHDGHHLTLQLQDCKGQNLPIIVATSCDKRLC